jgi:hypothetical protein
LKKSAREEAFCGEVFVSSRACVSIRAGCTRTRILNALRQSEIADGHRILKNSQKGLDWFRKYVFGDVTIDALLLFEVVWPGKIISAFLPVPSGGATWQEIASFKPLIRPYDSEQTAFV